MTENEDLIAEAVAAERERCARIAEKVAGSEPINSMEYSDWANWRAGRAVAAAIRKGATDDD